MAVKYVLRMNSMFNLTALEIVDAVLSLFGLTNSLELQWKYFYTLGHHERFTELFEWKNTETKCGMSVMVASTDHE